MGLFYLDPESEPRECHDCHGSGEIVFGMPDPGRERCESCRGSGRLGREGAEPDVNVFWWGGSLDEKRGHYYASAPGSNEVLPAGPFPTESEALAAARKAHVASK